jgi:DNA-binding NtrC family response regulator
MAPGRGTETVLYVEDEPAVRRIGIQILVEQGYRMLDAADAAQALELAASHPGPIHLLITDLVMPRVSGIELARRLVERRPDLRVLYTSGYSDHTAIQQGMLEPNVAFLQKPFTIAALARKVRELLDATT